MTRPLPLLATALVAFGTLGAAMPAFAQSTPSLSAHYTFDDGTGRDVSGNNRNTTGSASITNGCASFNGTSQFLSTGNISGLQGGNNARTVAFWVKTSAYQNFGFPVSIGNTQITPSYAPTRFTVGPAVAGEGYFLFTDMVSASNNIPLIAAEVPPLNDWHHVALAYDGARGWQFFLDGNRISAGAIAGFNITANAIDLGVVRNYSGSPYYFKGQMDDVRVYDGVLDISDIRQIAAVAPSCFPQATQCQSSPEPRIIRNQYVSTALCANWQSYNQQCSDQLPMQFDLHDDTQSLLVRVSTITGPYGPLHCSSVAINGYLDGRHVVGTPYLAPETQTGYMDLGPVASGQHTFIFTARGTPGGCNTTALWSWGVTANIALPPLGQCQVQAQCSDGIDNDTDGATDFPNDFSCSSANDNDETNPKAQCQDGLDNDNDGRTDFPQDPGCTSKQDNDETNASTPQCRDGIDNDGDGATDYPNDFSCSSSEDTDETNPKAACQDGIDNDNDGKTDFPQDPGCSSRQDNDEFNTPVAQCQDGIDNDNDGKIDMQDPGCSSPTDNDESNVVYTLPQCSDGIDNDGDGRSDFFDPGCYPNNIFNPAQYNPNDTDESNAAVLCRWARVNNQWQRQCQ